MGTAVEETKRQVIILVFSAVGTVVTVYLVYKFSRPDSFRELRMRTALRVKHFAQKQADYWQKIADDAATMYHKETS